MLLMAVDPGKTTGICIARVDKHNFQVVTCFEMSWEDRFEILQALISGTYNQNVPRTPDIVVTESFRLRQGRALQQSGSEFPSTQVNAIIQTFMYLYHSHLDLVFQEPSQHVGVKILLEHETQVLGSEHKKDAYQHARYYWAAHIKRYK